MTIRQIHKIKIPTEITIEGDKTVKKIKEEFLQNPEIEINIGKVGVYEGILLEFHFNESPFLLSNGKTIKIPDALFRNKFPKEDYKEVLVRSVKLQDETINQQNTACCDEKTKQIAIEFIPVLYDDIKERWYHLDFYVKSLKSPYLFTIKIKYETFKTNLSIQPNDPDLGKKEDRVLIGSDAGSNIYLTTFRGRKCVLKSYIVENEGKNDVKCLTLFSHPNVVDIYGYFIEDLKYYILMPLGESSYNNLYSKYSNVLNCELLIDIIRGIKCIHKHNIIHLDIKPENILIFKTEEGKLQAKICDFETARECKTNEEYIHPINALIGTPFYAAPESIRERKYSRKSDIFSFGRVMEVVLGKYSFQQLIECNNKLKENGNDYNYEHSDIWNGDDHVKSVLNEICALDSDKRIEYDEIERKLEELKKYFETQE